MVIVADVSGVFRGKTLTGWMCLLQSILMLQTLHSMITLPSICLWFVQTVLGIVEQGQSE